MDSTGTPTFTRAEAVLQAGEELLQEFGDPQELRVAIREAVQAAEEVEDQSLARRDRARHWRERMPELAEAMSTPQNERWKAHEIASMAAEIGIPQSRLDIPSIAREGIAAPAYISAFTPSTGALHRDLGIHPDQPTIPQPKIEAATKTPGDAGRRARLALRLIATARSGSR
jgi:hypothetical protein